MLIPLTREKFEQLIPLIATGNQYKYSWGKPRDVILRLLISVGIPLLLYLLHFALPDFDGLFSVLGIIAGTYVLWGPIFWSSLKNAECRRYKYSGFWRGEVLDAYVTDEVVGKQLTTNKRG
ncbi:MAG TPA: phosphate ABC transporter permease, partial [Cyanobacteria bacterium UBA11372]|nr:phosphate ABC transporter permease [Cyanobacteria bacterium UBA11372]